MFRFRRRHRRPPTLHEAHALPGHALKPPGKPRIIVSLDRSWHHRLGLTRFTFFRLIEGSGGVSLAVDYGTGPEPADIEPIAEDIIAQGDALLLSGGIDVDPALYGGTVRSKNTRPRRDRFELALITAAHARGLPILGVCRGCQLLNVAHGGTLTNIRHLPGTNHYHDRLFPHPIDVAPDSRLARIVKTTRLPYIRSLHGQIVDTPGYELGIVAHAPDGIPEAIESDAASGRWVIGVQWHPELMPFRTEEHRLFDELVTEANRRRRP